MLRNVLLLLGLGVAIAAVIKAPIAAGIAGLIALAGAMFDAFAVGFAGTQTLQHLMAFYTQAIGATNTAGIDQAATEFVNVLKSGTEFGAAVISLLTIGQSGWAEMEDALQSLLSLIRSIADRVGSVLLSPVIGSITSLFRLARNSVANVIDFLPLLINKISSNLIVPVLESLTTIFRAIDEFFSNPIAALNNLLDLLRSAGDDFLVVLDFLKRFSRQADVRNALMNPTKWGNLIEVARRLELPEYAPVSEALAAYPDAIGAILNFGSESVEILMRRSHSPIGESLFFWTKLLSEVSPDQGVRILGEISNQVWNYIRATQPFYERTLIPRSFELLASDGSKYWVHGNATEHLFDELVGYLNDSDSNVYADLYTQFLLDDFRQSVNQAAANGITFNTPIRVGIWEFVFAPPKDPGLLPTIFHAQTYGNIYVPH